jgi:hypothetical protein
MPVLLVDSTNSDPGIHRAEKYRRIYWDLRSGIGRLGGSIVYERHGSPHGAWIVRLSETGRVFPAVGTRTFKELDQLYVPKPGIARPECWGERSHDLVPQAVGKLVAMLN